MPSPFESREQYRYSPVDNESWVDKLARECYVFGYGTVGGIKAGAEQAWADKSGTAAKLGVTAGIGAAMAYAAEVGGVGRITAKLCGIGFGVAFVTDLLAPGRLKSIRETAVNTWASDFHTRENVERAKYDLGPIAFDTLAMTASGYAGAKLGQGLRPKVTYDAHGIANFTKKGFLPPGEYEVNWAQFTERFGTNPYRLAMLEKMKQPLADLKAAGVKEIFIGGSFVSAKAKPGDFDGGFRTSFSTSMKLMDSPVGANPKIQHDLYGGVMFRDGVNLGRGQAYEIKDFLSYNRRLNRPVGIIKLDVQNSPEIPLIERTVVERPVFGRRRAG
jgi:hypothetical protein